MRFMLPAILAGFTVLLPAQAPADSVSWMAGCWRLEAGGRTIDEMWMAPGGGTLLGVNRTVAGGRTASYEFMRIHDEGGRLVFTARPSGQAEASFPMLKRGEREVVFENAAHDFPQRVRYRLEKDTLIGRIEGTRNGQSRSVDYPMRRVECPRN